MSRAKENSMVIASKLESLKIHLMGWLWLVGSIKL